jgi:hypothetical protein
MSSSPECAEKCVRNFYFHVLSTEEVCEERLEYSDLNVPRAVRECGMAGRSG